MFPTGMYSMTLVTENRNKKKISMKYIQSAVEKTICFQEVQKLRFKVVVKYLSFQDSGPSL